MTQISSTPKRRPRFAAGTTSKIAFVVIVLLTIASSGLLFAPTIVSATALLTTFRKHGWIRWACLGLGILLTVYQLLTLFVTPPVLGGEVH